MDVGNNRSSIWLQWFLCLLQTVVVSVVSFFGSSKLHHLDEAPVPHIAAWGQVQARPSRFSLMFATLWISAQIQWINPCYYCGWLRNPAPVDRCFVPWFIGFQHVSTIIHSISHAFLELMMNMAKTFTADFTAPKNQRANPMDGVEHLNHLFMTFPILGMSSSQLTNSYFWEGLTPPTRDIYIYNIIYI